MHEHAACLERQQLAPHHDFHMPPIRKHSEPRSQFAARIRNVDAGGESRRMRKPAVLSDLGPRTEISIGYRKNKLDLALAAGPKWMYLDMDRPRSRQSRKREDRDGRA
jgi:hypothetical protein